jgi:CO dehydrogenase nickel-insertion accessory protein CooC1
LLGELASEDLVVADLEAGVGTLLRMQPRDVDVALVMCEPSTKSIEVAQRAADIAADRAAVVVVANRVHGDDDVGMIRNAFLNRDVVVVPNDPAIGDADRLGHAPIDHDPDAPGVRAIRVLSERVLKVSPRS